MRCHFIEEDSEGIQSFYSLPLVFVPLLCVVVCEGNAVTRCAPADTGSVPVPPQLLGPTRNQHAPRALPWWAGLEGLRLNHLVCAALPPRTARLA